MTGIILKQSALPVDLADVVTHESPAVRAMGRALAAGWLSGMQQWVQAEFARGTEPNALMRALLSLHVQSAASVAGCLFAETGLEACAENFKRLIDGGFVDHARRTAAAGRAGS